MGEILAVCGINSAHMSKGAFRVAKGLASRARSLLQLAGNGALGALQRCRDLSQGELEAEQLARIFGFLRSPGFLVSGRPHDHRALLRFRTNQLAQNGTSYHANCAPALPSEYHLIVAVTSAPSSRTTRVNLSPG